MTLGGGFEQVLIAAQANAGWAFTRLYESLAGGVTAYVRAQGIVSPDDVTSEVFLGVFTRLGTFRGTEEQFRSWVFTIAHHRIVDERRAQARRPRIDDRAGSHVGVDGRQPVRQRTTPFAPSGRSAPAACCSACRRTSATSSPCW